MFAIFGALIGFIQSMLPEGLKFLQDKNDKKHELEVMRLQMEGQKQGADSRLEEIRTTSQQIEAVALQKSYAAELKYSGKYSASVRPTITYIAMLIYATQKCLLVYAIIWQPELPWLSQTPNIAAIAAVIWTAFDETLLGWIIGFWFGSRQVKNSKQ